MVATEPVQARRRWRLVSVGESARKAVGAGAGAGAASAGVVIAVWGRVRGAGCGVRGV